MKASGIIYEQFYKGVRELPAELQAEAYNAYCEMVFYGNEYSGEQYAIKALLAMVADRIAEDEEKYQKTIEQRRQAGNKSVESRQRKATDVKQSERPSTTVNDRSKDETTVNECQHVYVYDNDNVSKSNDLDSAHEVKTAVQEKLEEYFDYLEDLDQKPVTLKARNIITQKLVSITDIESKQIQLIDEAMKNGWHNVYERGDPSAGRAKDGQQGELTDLDAWLSKQMQQNLSEVT